MVTGPYPVPAPGDRFGNDVTEPVRALWRGELAGVGGRSPLLHFDDGPTTRIELSTTHPGGLARFITGTTTLLSQLIRDDMALRGARIAADRIAAKGLELATTRGIDAIRLGIGIATWGFGDDSYCAPDPAAPARHPPLRPRRRAQAARRPAAEPGARRGARGAVRHRARRRSAFVALSDADGTFKPNAVIDQLRALTGHLADFSVQPRLVVSSFAEVAADLVADAHHLDHPILDALAGNATAKWAIEEGYGAVEPVGPDRREPSTDVLLLDADAEQENVVAQIAAGNSLVVKTMPGTGGTQTIVNALGALVGQNKRVLVVSPRRASLRAIARALRRHRAAGHHGRAAQPAPRHHPRHRPQREGEAAAARRRRRGARAPAQRAARLPRGARRAPTRCSGSRSSTA